MFLEAQCSDWLPGWLPRSIDIRTDRQTDKEKFLICRYLYEGVVVWMN